MSSNLTSDTRWFATFNSAFFLSIAALCFGFCGLVLKTCSKYKKINLCGIKLEREDTEPLIDSPRNDFIPIHTT